MIMFIIPCFQGCVKPEMPGAEGGETIYYLRYPDPDGAGTPRPDRFCAEKMKKHAQTP